MNLETKELAGILTAMGKVIPSRSPQEILQRVRFSSDGVAATVEAAAVDMVVRHSLGSAMDVAPMDCLVDHGRLLGFVRGASSGTMSLDATTNSVVVVSDRAKAELPSVSGREWPGMRQCQHSQQALMDAKCLVQCAERVSFAIEEIDTQFPSYILVSVVDGQLQMQCRSRRFYAFSAGPCTGELSPVVVPAKAFRVVGACASFVGDGQVALSADESALWMACGDTTVMAAQYAGPVPVMDSKELRNTFLCGDVWVVDRKQFMQFLVSVKPFMGLNTTTINLTPTHDGLLCQFDGSPDGDGMTSDAAGNLECLVSAQAAMGTTRRVSRDFIYSICRGIVGDKITMHAAERHLACCGEQFLGVVGLRA